MGICLRNKEYSMDMGYGSFGNLRKKIALLLNKDFGENYLLLSQCRTIDDYSKNDDRANRLIKEHNLDTDIIDFLYQPDNDGKISYKTCKKIYDVVKDYDDNCMYGYVHSNHSFSYFKDMLKNCYSKHRNLYWH